MYHSVGIQKLSENQLRKLLKGEPVRVKHGSHHKIHLAVHQLRKLNTAHKHGKASTITFDPYQQSQHAGGFFGDIARKAKELVKKHKHLLNPVIRSIKGSAHQGLNKSSKHIHENIEHIPGFEGGSVHHNKRRGRPSKVCGEGIGADVLGGLSKLAGFAGLGIGSSKNTVHPHSDDSNKNI